MIGRTLFHYGLFFNFISCNNSYYWNYQVNISFYKISFNRCILSWNSLWCPDILAMELLTMDPGALQNLLRYLTLPRGLMTLMGWIPFYIPGRSPLHYDDEEVDKGDILKLMMNICQDKAGISFFLNYLIVSRTNWPNKILSTKSFFFTIFYPKNLRPW